MATSGEPGENAGAVVCALELRLLDPETRRDRVTTEALLHPEFTEIGASGRTWDRAAVVAALADEPGRAVTVSELASAVLAPDVVLVTYRAVAQGVGASLRSSLWTKDGGEWRVRFHQGTPAPRD